MFEQDFNLPKSFTKLQQFLSEMTGNDLEEVQPESVLDEDLGFDLEADLARILYKVNTNFDIELFVKDVKQVFAETAATVEVLAKLIDDEIELG